MIRESLIDGLYVLKKKYRVSICLLVNVAIRNALLEEKMENENGGAIEVKEKSKKVM